MRHSAWMSQEKHKALWLLTQWGRVTQIYVGNLTILGLDTGLSPVAPFTNMV